MNQLLAMANTTERLLLVQELHEAKSFDQEKKEEIKKLIFANDEGIISAFSCYVQKNDKKELRESLLLCAEVKSTQEVSEEASRGYLTIFTFRLLSSIRHFLRLTRKHNHHEQSLTKLYPKTTSTLMSIEDAVFDTIFFRIVDAVFVIALGAFLARFKRLKPLLEWIIDY